MKPQHLIGMLMAASWLTVIPTQATAKRSPPQSQPTAKHEIEKMVANQQAAWNAGDAAGYSAGFAPDGSFTNIRGTLQYGKAAFEQRHREIFATVFKGSLVSMTPTRIALVRPDVAIADIMCVVDHLDGRAPPGIKLSSDGTLRTRLQEVLLRERGVWTIVSYHNIDVKGE